MVRMPRAAPSGCLTVNETLPPLREPRGETHVLQIRPEDWRQAELIDASLRPVAERMLAAFDARGVTSAANWRLRWRSLWRN